MTSGEIYAETLAVFEQEGYEPLTTPEVAEALDLKRRTVYKRLQKLVDSGKLETKETGSNSRVWWRPPAESDAHAASDGESTTRTDREIFQMIPDGVVLTDPDDGSIIDANQQFCEMLGYSRGELPELDLDGMVTDEPPYTHERAVEYVQRATTEGPQTFEWVDRTQSGEQIPLEVHLRAATVDGEDCVLGVVRDITERKTQQKEIRETAQQLQGILDTVEAAIFLKDIDGEYLLMNQNYRRLVGIETDEEVTGMTDEDLFAEGIATEQRADDQRAVEANETIEIEEELPTVHGSKTLLTRKTPIFDERGDPYAVCAVATDITERKDREQDLRASRQFNEELVENAPFGMFRLDDELRITYENPRAQEIIGLPAELEQSEAIGVDIREVPSIAETGQAERFSRLKDGETIEFEFPFESIYGKEAYFTGRGVPLYRDGEFDGAVLMANDISEHRQRERELERQREQLAAVNELHDVVRGITEAVIDQSTREEIEQVVCDRLAATDSYRFAWICSVDSDRRLEPRVKAGIGGQVTDSTLSVDPEDPTGQGPIASAVRTQEVSVTQNVRDEAEEEIEGFRSAAAIPVVHQGLLYGVLAVYSGRPDAFAQEEREVTGQLGEVIGHAIAAVNRKRALMSDEVIELEVRMTELLNREDVPTIADGTVSVERTVPCGDDEYLLYGTTTAESMEIADELCEYIPSWKAVRPISETESGIRFELELADPPISSTVAEYGGYVESGQIEGGEYTATLHLPPGTDIRRVIDDIRERYPSTESIRQKQVSRDSQSPRHLRGVLSEKLTDRQRAALEAGYYGGFFEWPRDRSGEDVATSLDIGASTFHQHVRKAERKLLDTVFTETGNSQIFGD